MEVWKLKNNSFKANQKGYSFIEVLMSVSILALVIVGVLTMTTVHIKTNSFALHHTKAVQLAEESVERLMRIDFNLLAGMVGSDQVEAYGTMDKYLDFTRTVSVAAPPAWTGLPNNGNNYLITARVRWRSLGQNSMPVTLAVVRTRQ
jgi:prepilin-type N-terminal cleavage/methylation domain-containing protein